MKNENIIAFCAACTLLLVVTRLLVKQALLFLKSLIEKEVNKQMDARSEELRREMKMLKTKIYNWWKNK